MKQYTSYKALLDGTLRRRGISPASAQVERVAQMTEFIATRMRAAWNYYLWPEQRLVEPRKFRAEWVAQSYVAGAEVFHLFAYWKASANSTAGDVPGASNKWDRMTSVRKFIPYQDAGKEPFDACLAAYFEDPRVTASREIEYLVSADGVDFPDFESNEVWAVLRRPAPDLAWSQTWAATSFVAGSVVYHSDEVWVAGESVAGTDIPGTSVKWLKQQVPTRLVAAVKLGAAADDLGATGQEDKEAVKDDGFIEALEEEVFQITKTQGQVGQR